MKELKTPYADLLEPLAPEDRAALAASIEQHGVTDPVLHDPDGNVLDGHNRLSIDPNAPRKLLKGSGKMSERGVPVFKVFLSYQVVAG